MVNRAAILIAAVVLGQAYVPASAPRAETPAFRQAALLVPSGIRELRHAGRFGDGPVLLRDGEGRTFRVGLAGARLTLAAAAAPDERPPGDVADMLPDTAVAWGRGRLHAAWFVAPTTRYDHGVLGDAIEAGGLAVLLDDGRRPRLELGPRAVFEDRVPRLADMDGDGVDEVLAVRATADAGAALVVVEVTAEGTLRLRAQADPIGQGHRWLNPVGVGDFDGDSRIEAAVVTTPHIGGVLRVYEVAGDRLKEEKRLSGFSNHAMGARELGLSAVADMDGDGLADLIVPDTTRRRLKVMSLAGGRLRTVALIACADRIVNAVLTPDLNGDGAPDIVTGLANRQLVAVLWRR